MCTHLYNHGGLCCGEDCYEEAELDAFEDDEDGWLDDMDDIDAEWWSIIGGLGVWEYPDYAEWWA